jgi:hypothetical protein
MTRTTTNRNDPGLRWGKPDETPVGQNEAYLVLTPEEIAKGFVRPLRDIYRHTVCGGDTRMSEDIAASYARDPTFYQSTYCVNCRKHRPVGPDGEFVWLDGTKVGA